MFHGTGLIGFFWYWPLLAERSTASRLRFASPIDWVLPNIQFFSMISSANVSNVGLVVWKKCYNTEANPKKIGEFLEGRCFASNDDGTFEKSVISNVSMGRERVLPCHTHGVPHICSGKWDMLYFLTNFILDVKENILKFDTESVWSGKTVIKNIFRGVMRWVSSKKPMNLYSY